MRISQANNLSIAFVVYLSVVSVCASAGKFFPTISRFAIHEACKVAQQRNQQLIQSKSVVFEIQVLLKVKIQNHTKLQNSCYFFVPDDSILIQKLLNVTDRVETGWMALHLAAEMGKFPHTSIQSLDYLLLTVANCYTGLDEIAEMLVKKNSTYLNTQDMDGYTPLLRAIKRSNFHDLDWIISKMSLEFSLNINS